MINALLALLTAALYGAAAWMIVRNLLDKNRSADMQTPLRLALAACALHVVLIALVSTASGQLTFQFVNAMSIIGWVVATIVLLLSLREPVASLGTVIFPLAGLAAAASALLPPDPQASHMEQGVALHVAVSVVAYGILMVSAVQACVLAVQNNRLHAHAAGGFIRKLPPLASMESLLFRLIGAGFLVLSLALVSGLTYLDDMFAQHLAHKTILSLLAWAVFGTLLIGRQLAGWRGRTAVRWTLAGSAILALAYLGSKFVAEVLLGA